MSGLGLLFLVLLQQPGSTNRVVVEPGKASISIGDTLRLRARVVDASGATVSGGTIQWFQSGGAFEGAVDSTGLVTAGATGTIVATVVYRPAGGGRPLTGVAQVTVLPLPVARVAVSPEVGTMVVGQSLTLKAEPFAANDDRRQDPVQWSSDDPTVVTVSPSGRLSAHKAGSATVVARVGRVEKALRITVGPNPVRTVAISPARTTARTGDVVRFTAAGRTAAGSAVAKLQAEWSITPGNAQIDPDGSFVADLPGTYQVFASYAGRTAEALVEVSPRDATRPVKVLGRLPIGMMTTEFWLHPNGRNGYLATAGLTGVGGDRLYAVDVSDPAKPRITDSVVVDARIINDVMATEDGKYAVMTREQASNRKNGIVILSLEDPAHPKPIADFTETVSGGVHSTYVYRGYVYLTDDATGSMRVIDIRDPLKPKQVARWETPPPAAGRQVHDIDVKEGLAYLSYWNDGLIILDVGNGIKGGSPENPVFVSQFKYDLNALYRDVEAVGGPGFIRGTHTAWRSGRYVFVADEVFPAKAVGQGVPGFGRAYGRMQVVDVSDVTKPKSVAWYESGDGGTHNIWVAGDTLFLGDYQGGLRILDVSGELKGDLLRQGRVIGNVATGDKDGHIPNVPGAWGAVYHNGHIYVPDVNSGLWIMQIEPRRQLTP
ncbi:MAG: Ig-like domain-containing protein [Gemmatimonadetes bacterium]|nr:Ig-like domain-containing protein [Gemmatimonadota bacterium]MCC7134280.1 Ig-like domain-containing protein [Gemmatimonadales bacterium]